jgi:hypothetical protein
MVSKHRLNFFLSGSIYLGHITIHYPFMNHSQVNLVDTFTCLSFDIFAPTHLFRHFSGSGSRVFPGLFTPILHESLHHYIDQSSLLSGPILTPRPHAPLVNEVEHRP